MLHAIGYRSLMCVYCSISLEAKRNTEAYMKVLTYFLYILAPPSLDVRPESLDLEDQQKMHERIKEQ